MQNIHVKSGRSCETGHDFLYKYSVIAENGIFSEKVIKTLDDKSPALISTYYSIIELSFSNDFRGKVIQHTYCGIGGSDHTSKVLLDNTTWETFTERFSPAYGESLEIIGEQYKDGKSLIKHSSCDSDHNLTISVSPEFVGKIYKNTFYSHSFEWDKKLLINQ